MLEDVQVSWADSIKAFPCLKTWLESYTPTTEQEQKQEDEGLLRDLKGEPISDSKAPGNIASAPGKVAFNCLLPKIKSSIYHHLSQ